MDIREPCEASADPWEWDPCALKKSEIRVNKIIRVIRAIRVQKKLRYVVFWLNTNNANLTNIFLIREPCEA